MTLGLISAYQYIYNGLASQYSNQLLISVHYRSVATIIHNRSSNSVNFCTFGYGNRCRRIFPEFLFFNAFHIIVPSQRGGGAFRKVKTIQLLFFVKVPVHIRSEQSLLVASIHTTQYPYNAMQDSLALIT